jgi:hypothetical protein
MGRAHSRRRLGTALLALIAAYAQLLSIFVAYAASDVQPALTGLICGHDGQDGSSRNLPSHHGNDCCVAACCTQVTTAAPDASCIVVAPQRLAIAASFVLAQERVTRPASGIALRARGPPFA